MKKLIAALCVLAVAVGTAFAVNNNSTTKQMVKMPVKNERTSSLTTASAPLSFERYANEIATSTPYDYSAQGYGWYQGYNRKIAWSPEVDFYGSCYRQANTAGSGSLGMMAGSWATSNEFLTIQSQSSTFSARYPSVCSVDGYIIGVYNHNAAAPHSAYITVYSQDEEGAGGLVQVKAPDGATPNNAWCGLGDATKDANGNYYVMTTWEYDGLNGASAKKVCVVVGKSATPYVGSSWVWSNWNDVSAVAGGEDYAELERLKPVWGKNGFGIAITVGKAVTGDVKDHLYYTYTKDYGQTWIKDNGKLFKFDPQGKFPFVGQHYTTAEGEQTIELAGFNSDFDVVIDDKNDVHLILKAHAHNGVTTNYWPTLAETNEGTPVRGWWLLTADFDDNGNPASSDMWSSNYIARVVGCEDTDEVVQNAAGEDEKTEDKYSNYSIMSLGYAGRGTLVASWSDRTPTAPKLCETWAAEQNPPLTAFDPSTTFIDDPYVIVSSDYGKTWQYADAAKKRAYQITVHPENTIHEEGFTVSKRGKVLNPGDAATVEIYAGYQKAMYGSPAFDPVTGFFDYKQELHVMQIKMNPVGIEAQVLSDKAVELEQNYPNPFNPTTAINFNLQNAGKVNLSVFNAKGEEVANLINSNMVKGAHTANFNAANLNSGVYFYKLTVDGQSAVKKMVLTK